MLITLLAAESPAHSPVPSPHCRACYHVTSPNHIAAHVPVTTTSLCFVPLTSNAFPSFPYTLTSLPCHPHIISARMAPEQIRLIIKYKQS